VSKPTLGQLLEDAVHQYGVLGHLSALHGDTATGVVSLVGFILDSDGRIAIRYPEYEGDYEPATFVRDVSLFSTEPPEV
jgi:hypothetical protein